MRARCYYYFLDEVDLETVRARVHVAVADEPVGEPGVCRDLGVRVTAYPDASAVIVEVGGGGPVIDLSWATSITDVTWEDAERLARALGYDIGRGTGIGLRVSHKYRVVYVGGWPELDVSGRAGRAKIVLKKGKPGFRVDVFAWAQRPLVPALAIAIPFGKHVEAEIEINDVEHVDEIAEYVARVRDVLGIRPRF